MCDQVLFMYQLGCFLVGGEIATLSSNYLWPEYWPKFESFSTEHSTCLLLHDQSFQWDKIYYYLITRGKVTSNPDDCLSQWQHINGRILLFGRFNDVLTSYFSQYLLRPHYVSGTTTGLGMLTVTISVIPSPRDTHKIALIFHWFCHPKFETRGTNYLYWKPEKQKCKFHRFERSSRETKAWTPFRGKLERKIFFCNSNKNRKVQTTGTRLICQDLISYLS